jgi:Uma2 family endonuclease
MRDFPVLGLVGVNEGIQCVQSLIVFELQAEGVVHPRANARDLPAFRGAFRRSYEVCIHRCAEALLRLHTIILLFCQLLGNPRGLLMRVRKTQLCSGLDREGSVLCFPAMYAERNEPTVVRYSVPTFLERWTVPDTGVTVPEAPSHDQALKLLQALLDHWVSRTARDAAVYRNAAIRIRRDKPQMGFDPDLCLVEPAPPHPNDIDSVCLWKAGNNAPAVSIEVVSNSHPYKDYTEIPDRCAAAGVGELIVFDPRLVGPRAHGGPHLLQLWQRSADGAFDRVHAGDGPAWSTRVGAWLVPVENGRLVRLAEDRDGTRLWQTATEAALARVAELEAELRRRG